ncbi:MAG: PilT/PilU family type 4a pilus ATPase [Proteobacteria bacterium]|nr:PilT/PilU family type 4a pilus ATPase [Pseudomonadota bacterium]
MDNTIFQLLLDEVVNHGASDLHLSCKCKPVIRMHGELVAMESYSITEESDLNSVISLVLNEKQSDVLKDKLSYDIGYSSDRGERYRINIYYERGSLALAIRWLNGEMQNFEELNLPAQLAELSRLKDGLVLMTGATGSGKTTALASVLNQINEYRPCHILTIEDPIEFIHENKMAVVHQREVGVDVLSFADAMRSALREDPDVVLVGEMRDLETMRAALMVAETGHLVFSTLHTNDAVGVIDRMIGAFPGAEQNNVRQQLSMVLRAVVTQTLVKNFNEDGRVPINEILWVNHAVSHLIREHKPEQIRSVMETGKDYGNQTLEQAIAARVINKEISMEQGLKLTTRAEQLKELVNLEQKRPVYSRRGNRT